METEISADERFNALLRRLTLALLGMGLLWRTVRYLLQFPIFGDEAMLCLNFLELDYGSLLRELHNCQVAPILFLWGELTSLRWFGGSPLAMHLLSYLAGVGSLLLFWRLVVLVLPPLARTMSLGFLAVAIWPVSMSALAKPYAFDLFMSLLLLVPAVSWLRQTRQIRWLVLETMAVPIAVFGSYPAVFVAGGISLGLLPAVRRLRAWQPSVLYVAFNVVLFCSFTCNCLFIANNHLRTFAGATTTETGMRAYWAEGFPPGQPLALAKWLLFRHIGQLAAYPIGAQYGGSLLTVLLCLVGARYFWRSGRRDLLILGVAPFVLWFSAAVLHRYPYGPSCRVGQHVAPAICLAAGMGTAVLLERIQALDRRRRWILGVGTSFLLIGVGGMVRDLVKPYRDGEALWTYRVMKDLAATAHAGVPLVVLNDPEEIDPLFRWYLELFDKKRVFWHGRIDRDKLASSTELVCVRFRYGAAAASPSQALRAPIRTPAPVPSAVAAELKMQSRPWTLAQATTDTGVPPFWHIPLKHLDQYRWVRDRADQVATRRTASDTHPRETNRDAP